MDSAFKMKLDADSLYGNNYWTPQLLYWEAVYYIKKRQDSNALNSLNAILMMPTSDVKLKSKVAPTLQWMKLYILILYTRNLIIFSTLTQPKPTKTYQNLPKPTKTYQNLPKPIQTNTEISNK